MSHCTIKIKFSPCINKSLQLFFKSQITFLSAGNLFSVSLSTLLLRDSQLTNEENNIPLIFQKLLTELTERGIKEEGILRVGGNKQKVEQLCTELETDFYSKPKEADKLIERTPCHDLSAVLKKLLRDLPQPLLTVEYIDAFYQSHGEYINYFLENSQSCN